MNKTPDTPLFADASPFHALLNRMDWSASPLGAPATWPAALRANVAMLLDARVPMGMVWGPARCMIYNEAYTSLLGEKHPWALGRPVEEVWAEIWPHIAPLVEGALGGEARDVQDLALEIKRHGRLEAGWFTIFCSPLRDDAGVVRGLSSTVIETTARVRAELEVRELNRTLDERVAARTAELERSEAHLRSLLRQTTAGIAEIGLDLRFVAANDKYCEIVGRSREALLGLTLPELVDPDDVAANATRLDAMLRSGQPFEIENRYLRPDGTQVWVTEMVAPIVEQGERSPTSILAVVVDVTQRKEAEERSRESAVRMQLAADATRLGIWCWNIVDDTATWENSHMYEIFGVQTAAEPVNVARFMAEFIHPNDLEPYRQALADSLATGRFHFEGRFHRGQDRALRWFEFTGQLHYDAAGRPLRMLGTAADITERKQVVEQLRSAQARLEATLGAGEIGTWLFDLRAYTMHADANMLRLHGIREDAGSVLSPLVYAEAVHPDDLPKVSAAVARSRATGEPYDCVYRVRLAHGGQRILHARGQVEYEDGAPARLPGVVIDLTRQKEAEEQLRVREQRYRTLLTSIDEGFCLVEVVHDEAGRPVDHRILETNPAFARHTGVDDAVGKTASQVAPGIEQRWNEVYAEVARTGKAVRIVERNGAFGRWFDVFVAKAEGAADNQVAIVFRDITAQKQADEALRQLAADLARANRRQNEFLATLAHELRNPLAPIRTGLDLMRLNPGNGASVGKLRDMMERQLNHLIHLVNDLLDLARIQSGKIELKRTRVLLKDIVADAVEASLPLVESRQHALEVQLPDQDIWLDADPNRLVQVIGNLLTNAAKYTPEHGRIALALRREGGSAVVEVRDNGIGIPAEALPGLFEMFNQVRHGSGYAQGGLGIGLSLVRRLVQKHGGTVEASSAGPGQGSTFLLRLPVAPGASTSDEAAPAPPPRPAGGHLSILVADDNQDAAELLAQTLRLQGHEVAVVHDGHAALAAVAAMHPDLALLDIGMPGMDGYEVAEAIRRDPGLRRTVLAALTGWGADEDRERARRAGFDHHLTKPVGLDSVRAIVDAIRS